METTENTTETFEIPIEAAELYESAFVPAFFAQWAPVLCRETGVSSGDDVLDVGCGTGIVARTAAALAGSERRVVGLDLNQAMLTVAARTTPGIRWRQGDATELPFADGSFDRVLSQMAMMFFPDRATAAAEMTRVVRPAGRVAVLVPGRLDVQPAFAPFVEMATTHAGPEAATLLSSYFACGDLHGLGQLLAGAGLEVEVQRTESGTYRAPSVEAFVATEVGSTPLAERIDAPTHERITEGARDVLAPYTLGDGRVEAPFVSNVVVARRP